MMQDIIRIALVCLIAIGALAATFGSDVIRQLILK